MNDLDRLAELYGIQTNYIDIWGEHHLLAEQTKRLLLTAMDLEVDSEEQLRGALQHCLDRPWQQALPPVLVVRQGCPVEVPLVLSDAEAGVVRWRVTEEDGSFHEGRCPFRELELLEQREVSGEARARRNLRLELELAAGYHALTLLDAGGQGRGSMALIVTPGRCYSPAVLDHGGRVWGPAVQLYGVRSRRNWGMGDYTDLLALCEACPELGASLVGLNPLHALFPHNPPHASPYCPSSRLMHNILYLDVEAIEELQQCPQAQSLVRDPELRARLQELRDSELVDYGGVAAAKRPVLEALYRSFRQQLETDGPRAAIFCAYLADGGEALRLHGLYEALQEHFFAQDQGLWGWPVWPAPFCDPRSDEVRRFEAEHQERVEFFQYLQWQVDLQLGAAARRCAELGLEPGLYQDLSVSVDRAGSEIWANQHVFAMEASVGAPPDALGPQGQNWGLPPMVPHLLTEAAYAPFVAILRRCMRHAGALRIDHVMGLMRLFWIPQGMTPAAGAYVHYPLADLLGIVALESQRNRCLVIGEDLGTVPDDVRQALVPAGVLSYRLLYFEREGDGFKRPEDYPERALVAVTTHDLPTLAGFWSGEDLRVRDELDLYPNEQVRQEFVSGRDNDRARLLEALAAQGLLPLGGDADPASWPEMSPELTRAVCRYLASAPSDVMVVQFEDVLGQKGQANMPGTTDEHPNWLRKLSMDLENLLQDPRVSAMARTLDPLRGHGSKSEKT